MRKPFIAGNWKLNKTIAETDALVKELVLKLKDVTTVDIAICPTFLGIPLAVKLTQGTSIAVGGQNLFWEPNGAYTGEISGQLLKAAGCDYVIIGHSERRQYFGETNATVNQRIHAAYAAGLKPILCIGETLEEREADQTFAVVKTQLLEGLAHIDPPAFAVESLTIAYEPVWAIGTGKTATKEQAQEVHAYIRSLLSERYGQMTSDVIRIQYGGSVKPNNARELMTQPDIDGALVGGASLNADDFIKIVKFQID